MPREHLGLNPADTQCSFDLAAVPEADVIVDSKLTASFDLKLHQATLDVLKGIQVTVL